MSGEIKFAIALDVLRCILLLLPLVYVFFCGPIALRRYKFLMVVGGTLIFWGGFLDLTDEIPSLNTVPVFGEASPYHEHIKDTFGYIPGLILFASGMILNTRELRRLDRIKIDAYERMLPMCCGCEKIRLPESADKHEVWCTLEEYMREHNTVEFTHTFCPECLARQYERMKAQQSLQDEEVALTGS